MRACTCLPGATQAVPARRGTLVSLGKGPPRRARQPSVEAKSKALRPAWFLAVVLAPKPSRRSHICESPRRAAHMRAVRPSSSQESRCACGPPTPCFRASQINCTSANHCFLTAIIRGVLLKPGRPAGKRTLRSALPSRSRRCAARKSSDCMAANRTAPCIFRLSSTTFPALAVWSSAASGVSGDGCSSDRKQASARAQRQWQEAATEATAWLGGSSSPSSKTRGVVHWPAGSRVPPLEPGSTIMRSTPSGTSRLQVGHARREAESSHSFAQAACSRCLQGNTQTRWNCLRSSRQMQQASPSSAARSASGGGPTVCGTFGAGAGCVGQRRGAGAGVRRRGVGGGRTACGSWWGVLGNSLQ
mmetsp:Transcript_101760/g.314058  ORF Transcript_101760/g.314058 Transcript_101760/m.314058 type:complete len:360 (-) Transcript_101760:94-1173(-)